MNGGGPLVACADLPFQGTYTGTNALPAAFTLGRSTCDPVLVGVSGVPAGAPAGNAPAAGPNPPAAPANRPAAGAPAPQQPAPHPTKKHKKHGDGGD